MYIRTLSPMKLSGITELLSKKSFSLDLCKGFSSIKKAFLSVPVLKYETFVVFVCRKVVKDKPLKKGG